MLSSKIMSSSGSISCSKSSSSRRTLRSSLSCSGSGTSGSESIIGSSSSSEEKLGLCGKNSSSSVDSGSLRLRFFKNIITPPITSNAGININAPRTNGLLKRDEKLIPLSCSIFFALCCSIISFCLSISSLSCF